MGGKKCKINIEKIEKKSVKWVTFSKRRNGLYRKATELCRLSPSTQIAILATPLSSHSHASFYSFGHSSVDHVVSSFLRDQSPLLSTNQDQNNNNSSGLGLGFWWEDEGFDTSEDVDELRAAADAITRMLNNVRLRLDAFQINQRENLELISYQEDTNQTPHEFGGASASESLLENDKDNLQLISYEEKNQTPKFGGASTSESLLENANDKTNDQILEFGGSMFEIGEDNLDIDDLLTSFDNNEPFFIS